MAFSAVSTIGADLSGLPADDVISLLEVAHELSSLRDLSGVMGVVRGRARQLIQADGVSFVLREGDQVFYADEDAIGPLWKGRRFPASSCVSGWAMDHRQTVVIPDVYQDDRVPVTAYRPTFVKSLLMVPIRAQDPVGAIGAYWANAHAADDRERRLMETVAGFAAVAVSNAQLYQEARDAVRARDEWLGLASHELRTPLTPLKLQIESLSRAFSRGTPVSELAPRIRGAERSIERLSRLVEQLLDYRRFSSMGVSLQLQNVDVAALAAEVCSRFRTDDPVLPVAVDLVSPDELWLRCDRFRVEEIVTNLVSNAVKYGAGQAVVVQLAAHGHGVRLVVADQGQGIRPEDQERIFHPFTRISDSRQGVGLGLWIVRSLVQAHGGSIEVDSAPGAGTRMVVSLPSVAEPLSSV
jgi:signal transduction histidine kinase